MSEGMKFYQKLFDKDAQLKELIISKIREDGLLRGDIFIYNMDRKKPSFGIAYRASESDFGSIYYRGAPNCCGGICSLSNISLHDTACEIEKLVMGLVKELDIFTIAEQVKPNLYQIPLKPAKPREKIRFAL